MKDFDTMQMQTEAATWFFRLQEPDCSAADRAACEQWRARSPAHERAYQQMAMAWRQGLAHRADPELEAELGHVERMNGRGGGGRWRNWAPLLATAACLLLLSVLAFQLRQAPEPSGTPYRTAVGEQRTVALPDGSTLVLDTDTAVRVDYSKARRAIELEMGQASFAVARDAARPFQVRAAGGSVTALGTRFLVRTDATATAAAVTLLEGQVVVEAPRVDGRRRAPATLAPGQRLRFDRNGHEWSTTAVDLDEASAWTSGSVYARDWPLPDLLAEMNRYATTPVRVADPDLTELRISGTFHTGDTPSFVRSLTYSWPLHATQGEDGSILLSRRSE